MKPALPALALVSALVLALGGCKNLVACGDAPPGGTFATAHGKAAVVLVRPDATRRLPVTVTLDDRQPARTVPCSYAVWQVEPGNHQIFAYGENVTQLSLHAEAGRTYFVRLDATGGLWSPRSQLGTLDEAGGRKAAEACRQIEPAAAAK